MTCCAAYWLLLPLFYRNWFSFTLLHAVLLRRSHECCRGSEKARTFRGWSLSLDTGGSLRLSSQVDLDHGPGVRLFPELSLPWPTGCCRYSPHRLPFRFCWCFAPVELLHAWCVAFAWKGGFISGGYSSWVSSRVRDSSPSAGRAGV